MCCSHCVFRMCAPQAWATVIGANLSGLVVTLFCFYKAGRLCAPTPSPLPLRMLPRTRCEALITTHSHPGRLRRLTNAPLPTPSAAGVSAAVVSLESQLADSGKIGAGVVSGFGTLSNVTQNALSTTEGSASAVLLNYTKARGAGALPHPGSPLDPSSVCRSPRLKACGLSHTLTPASCLFFTLSAHARSLCNPAVLLLLSHSGQHHAHHYDCGILSEHLAECAYPPPNYRQLPPRLKKAPHSPLLGTL